MNMHYCNTKSYNCIVNCKKKIVQISSSAVKTPNIQKKAANPSKLKDEPGQYFWHFAWKKIEWLSKSLGPETHRLVCWLGLWPQWQFFSTNKRYLGQTFPLHLLLILYKYRRLTMCPSLCETAPRFHPFVPHNETMFHILIGSSLQKLPKQDRHF